MTASPTPPGPAYVPPAWTQYLEFDLLVQSISDYAIFLLDLNGLVVTWNQGAERFKGYKAHEIIGHSYTLFYPPKDTLDGKPQRLLATALREGRVEDEGWRIRKDGSSFWADVVITPVRDKQGEVLGFCKITRDLTERREAETRSTFLAAVFDNMPGGIAILGRDLVFQMVNQAYARVFGKRPEDFARKQVFEIFPDTEGQVKGILEGVLRTGQPFTAFSFPFQFAEAGARHETFWDFTYAPIRGKHGEVEGILALCLEVTPRVRLEREMAEQQALTERIVANAPAGIAFLDHDLVYRRLNPRYAHLLGMTVAQMVDRSIYEVFPGATDQIEAWMREVQATGQPFTTTDFSFRFQLDGVERQTYWDFTYQPVPDRDGKPGILILGAEVSDRHQKERLQSEHIAQLQELDRYKDEFLSVISHELRTPLNFIMGFASLLEDEVQGPLNPPQHQAVDRILNGADRMLLLVDDLLDFAKIQSGHLELACKTASVAQLVEEARELLTPLAEQKGVSLETDVAGDLTAWLDPDRTSQVLTNLLNNAIKFTAGGGHIAIRSYARGPDIVTEVCDTGCGIAPEHVDKLFRRFQQLDMSNTRQASGTGLGLAISRALVEAHGGTIGVDSTPGVGSTFWFTLPVAGVPAPGAPDGG